MRARLVPLAVGIWAIVVAAAVLLFASVVFCLSFDLSQTNGALCYISGASWYFDIVAVVGGISFLVLIDDMVDNPSRLGALLSTWVARLWMTITISISLLYISYLLPLSLLSIVFVGWVGLGIVWAALFIREAFGRSNSACERLDFAPQVD